MHANPVFGEVPTEMQAYIALLVQQAVQRQQEQQQQELQLLVQRLDELEAENAQLKEWLAKLGVDCGATALRAKQQLDDGVSANNRVQELAEQQQQLEMRLQQQLSDIAPRLPAKCVVHAPADYLHTTAGKRGRLFRRQAFHIWRGRVLRVRPSQQQRRQQQQHQQQQRR